VVVRPDPGALADEARCPPEPAIPVLFVDDTEAALWVSRMRDAGAQCRSAFKALREFVK
jgi:hypothetical protein